MFWKVISRTVHSILGIGGLVMQGVGLYFVVAQATVTPTGPLGLSILNWGIILFDIFAISVIAQLWWHIHKIEGSYAYSLSFDGLDLSPHDNKLSVYLKFSNTSDRPIEYKVNVNETCIVLGDQQQINNIFYNTGVIIPKHKGCVP